MPSTLAAGLVGTAEYYLRRPEIDGLTMVTIGLEVVLGFDGDRVVDRGRQASGNPSRSALDVPRPNVVNVSVLCVAFVLVGIMVIDPGRTVLFPIVIVVSLVFGSLLVIRMSGATPTVIPSRTASWASRPR